jgi:NAD(P)-dependent dehydrogenase (short-subunit alcohol dehydrogenase family)
VGIESEVEAMCAEVKRDFGTIDILVNNAAINRDKTFKRLTKEAWDEVINTDLTSVFLVTKHFIDEMADRGWGRVINMSNMSGEHDEHVGRDRQLRPGQLRGGQGGNDRVDQDDGAGVVYLASPSAGFVTGVVLDINGGSAM